MVKISEVEPSVRQFQDFQYGDCPIYAIVLHEITGLPLMAMLDYSEEIEKTVLVHAFVSYNGKAIDSEGIKDIQDIENECPIETETWIAEITPEELLQLGYDGNCPTKHQAINHAKFVLRSLNIPMRKS